jgi:hypothetical protein
MPDFFQEAIKRSSMTSAFFSETSLGYLCALLSNFTDRSRPPKPETFEKEMIIKDLKRRLEPI